MILFALMLGYAMLLGWFVANPVADRLISRDAGMIYEGLVGFAILAALTAVSVVLGVATAMLFGLS